MSIIKLTPPKEYRAGNGWVFSTKGELEAFKRGMICAQEIANLHIQAMVDYLNTAEAIEPEQKGGE